jgi:hypothetical protein
MRSGRDLHVCAPPMIIIRSSHEPTSATAGHAPTTAPIRPWPRPWATFAATVVNEPVHCQGDEASGPARFAVLPHESAPVLIRHNSSNRGDADHSQRR